MLIPNLMYDGEITLEEIFNKFDDNESLSGDLKNKLLKKLKAYDFDTIGINETYEIIGKEIIEFSKVNRAKLIKLYSTKTIRFWFTPIDQKLSEDDYNRVDYNANIRITDKGIILYQQLWFPTIS